MTDASATLVEYFVAAQGTLSDGALGLLAARGALLGHARWRTRPAYATWHSRVMSKVVLAADADDLARVRAASDALVLTAAGDEPMADEIAVLVVLPPQPKALVTALVGHLRLAPRRRGPAPEPTTEPVLVMAAADDLGMHGGKLAAQCAHAALLANRAYGRHSGWATWIGAGRPMALRRLASDALADLAARYSGGAVRDAGHTQVPAGSLTVVAVPPWTEAGRSLLADGEPWH
jgi:PTH2 family peptidyl-tRNA hydrolase